MQCDVEWNSVLSSVENVIEHLESIYDSRVLHVHFVIWNWRLYQWISNIKVHQKKTWQKLFQKLINKFNNQSLKINGKILLRLILINLIWNFQFHVLLFCMLLLSIFYIFLVLLELYHQNIYQLKLELCKQDFLNHLQVLCLLILQQPVWIWS